MSMGNIRLSPDEMNQKATEFNQQGEEFEACVEKMGGLVSALEQEWEGQSSQAFAQQFNDLRPSFQKTKELINDIAQQLRDVSEAMVSVDQEISQKIGVK